MAAGPQGGGQNQLNAKYFVTLYPTTTVIFCNKFKCPNIICPLSRYVILFVI